MVSFTLQEVKDCQRPQAGMGPSPRALLIWIFEKKAQRNKIFFYLKVMGTSTRTRLYISKRSFFFSFFDAQKIHLNTKKLEIFPQEWVAIPFEFWVFEITSNFFDYGGRVCLEKKIIIIISFQIHLSHILNFKKYLILCYLKF